MPTAIYLPEARDDIDTAYSDYESHSTGLGDRFLEAVAKVVHLIETNPALYGEVAPDIRAAMTRRFPFVVYYREEPTQLVVIAVRHGRSNPSIWQERV
ncbi:MAG TPA: type II toxin-antitoxin system RelE/ParE family toxin [Gemmata sp.]|jgi:plasmid stabilization system protein ParE|nr:type II toxin-antitoxin system RelE/ParE family toxin [Gemmata sp.]